MASLEGIRSPSFAQRSARSAKLHIYESLFLLNQGIDQVVTIMHAMERLPLAHKEALQSAQAEIEEVRASTNADFLEELADRERHEEGHFSKQRQAYEEKLKDPDDVYVGVEEREEERKKQGLPPRVGIIPYSAVAAEEERWEEQQRKKKRARKTQDSKANAKSAARGKVHD